MPNPRHALLPDSTIPAVLPPTDQVGDRLAGEPLLLSIPRVAELLGLSRSRAYALVATGVIPSRRLTERSLVVPTPLLARWLCSTADVEEGIG